MLLRYAHEDLEDTVLQNSSVGKVARMDDRTQRKVARTDDRTLEGKVARMDDQTLERNNHNY